MNANIQGLLIAAGQNLKRLLSRWDAPLVNDFFAMIFYGVLHPVLAALPVLLGISASSPYWMGEDSGYASVRSLVLPGAVTGEVLARTGADRVDLLSDPGGVRKRIGYVGQNSSAGVVIMVRVSSSLPGMVPAALPSSTMRKICMRSSSEAVASTP